MTYSVNLVVAHKKCLVVGGGRVALRKAKDLARAGAYVKVISPDFREEFRRLKNVDCIKKRFKREDLNGSFLVIAATNNKKIQERIARLSQKANILVNVVDNPKLCDFFVPSKISRGHLTISISTNGEVPLFSKMLKYDLQKLYPRRFGIFLSKLAEFRKDKSRWKAALNRITSSNVIEVLRNKGLKSAMNVLESILNE